MGINENNNNNINNNAKQTKTNKYIKHNVYITLYIDANNRNNIRFLYNKNAKHNNISLMLTIILKTKMNKQ